MTDLRDVVDVRGLGQPTEFVRDGMVGSEVLDAVQLPEDAVLRKAAAPIRVRGRYGRDPYRLRRRPRPRRVPCRPGSTGEGVVGLDA